MNNGFQKAKLKRIGSENLRNHLRFFIIGTVFSIEPSVFEFCKPSLNNMQTFYETNRYFYKRGKNKKTPTNKDNHRCCL